MALGFTLTADGADKVTGGLKGLFGSLGNASIARQLGEQKTGLTSAQIYHQQMSGNKAGAEADSERFTLQNRQGADAEIANNPDLTPVQKLTLWAFKNAGAGKVKDFAGAGTEYQTQGFRDKAAANIDDPETMNKYSTIAKPGATYMPFDNIGNTGTVFNKATGDGSVASSTLDKLYGNESNSRTDKNISQADNADASAERNRASTDFIRAKSANVGANGKPLTAAQLRSNAEVDQAREDLTNMTDVDVAAIEKQNPTFMSARERLAYDRMKLAKRAKFGEDTIPQTTPQVSPPKEKPRGLLDTVANIFNSKPAPAKSPATGPAPITVTTKAQMDALPSGTRFTAPDGTTRIKP
jgi:hypothetical protein